MSGGILGTGERWGTVVLTVRLSLVFAIHHGSQNSTRASGRGRVVLN